MNKKILFIGYGSIAIKHIKIIKKKTKSPIYVLSKHFKGEKKLIKISLKKALNTTYEYCFICTPSTERMKYLKLFENNCKSFFLEKPISNNYKKAKYILSKIKSKKNIYIGYVFRNNLIIKSLKKIIEQKKLGIINSVQVISRSYMPSWRNNIDYKNSVSSKKSKGGGVLLELSHEIDILFYLFGNIKLFSKRLTRSKNLKINVEDRADIMFLNKNKIPINLLLDFNSYLNERRIIINGSKSLIDVNLNSNFYYIYTRNKKKKYEFKNEISKMFYRQLTNYVNNNFKNNSVIDSLKVLKIIDEIKKN